VTEPLDKLRQALNENEPKFVRILASTRTGADVTFRDLEKAIGNGLLTLETLDQWQQDYARLVSQRLDPLLQKVAELARPGLSGNQALRASILRQEMNLVSNLTTQQVKAIRGLVYRGYAKGWSESTIAQYLRPIIGLSNPQAVAVQRYMQGLIDHGMREPAARRKAQEYASRLWRQRAQTLARTELASAYALGEEAFVRAEQAAGRMGAVQRVWVTAGDEFVCETCGPLDGATVLYLPPLHPTCHCTIDYVDVRSQRTVS
jgi:aminopeptidase N